MNTLVKVSRLGIATILCASVSLGAFAHGGPDGQGPNRGSNMTPGQGMGQGMGQGPNGTMRPGQGMYGYGDFDRMQRLIQQMHRTDDYDSHYQLMRQHWQEMERTMDQLQMHPGVGATPEQLQERDRTIDQLREQMRQHQQEFERQDYHRGMMR